MTNITKEIRNLDSFNYLIKERAIPDKNIETAINDWDLELTNRTMKFTMRDIEGNVVWYQQRDLDNTTCKSKCLPWSKVWYFGSSNISPDDTIAITEGEIDYLTMLNHENLKIVWLQWVQNLHKLVGKIIEIWCETIFLLCDNDDAWRRAMNEVAINYWVDLRKMDEDNNRDVDHYIADCSIIYSDYKDVNDFYKAGYRLSNDILCDLWEMVDWGYIQDVEEIENQFPNINDKVPNNSYQKAQDLLENNHLAFVWKSWFKYSPESWLYSSLNSEELDNIIVDYLLEIGDEVKSHTINEISKLLRVIWQNKTLWEALKSKLDPNLINLQDWIYNLWENSSRPYEQWDYCLSQLPYSSNLIDEQSHPTRLLEFLREIFDWRSVIPSFISFIQEWMGYCLTANTKFEKWLILYWSWANWKSVLINVIRSLVWEENAICLPLDQVKDKNYLIHILWKLLLVDSDSHDSVQIDSSLIKKIVSWEEIAWNMKHKDVISFKPYAKVLVWTNILPHIKNFDNAARRRFIFIHLKNSFKDNPNPNLLDEILEEKDQIFARAFEGLLRLMERWKFQIPEELDNEIDSIFRESDYIQDFLESTYIYEHEWHRISYDKLKEAYNQYATLHGHPKLNTRKLWNLLEKKWFGKYRTANHRWIVWLSTRILLDNQNNE